MTLLILPCRLDMELHFFSFSFLNIYPLKVLEESLIEPLRNPNQKQKHVTISISSCKSEGALH